MHGVKGFLFPAAPSVYLGVAVCSFATEEQSVEIIASNIVEHLEIMMMIKAHCG